MYSSNIIPAGHDISALDPVYINIIINALLFIVENMYGITVPIVILMNNIQIEIIKILYILDFNIKIMNYNYEDMLSFYLLQIFIN